MSGLNWGIGDLLAVTKLAWDLYHNCYLVARDAPKDFRQLIDELGSLQGVLRTLNDDINSDESFIERLGDSRKETLERCLGSCFNTLNKLQKLVFKYRELGVSDGAQFWRKLKWAGKQGEIADLKSRLVVHTSSISLCMHSMGNSSLARIETSIKALERQEASRDTIQVTQELTPVARSQATPIATTSEGSLDPEEPDDVSLHGITRAFTGATLVDTAAHASVDLTPPASDAESSEEASSKEDISMLKPVRIVKKGRASTFDGRHDEKPLPPSPLASEGYWDEAPRKSKQNRRRPTDSKSKCHGGKRKSTQDQGEVIEAVAVAMQELSGARRKEQSARPLRIIPEDPAHRVHTCLNERFQQLVRDELEMRTLTTKAWLRIATWWLLKARYHASELENPTTADTKPLLVSSNSAPSTNQAYADLLKSSWIMHTIILDQRNISSLMTDENRKMFYNLSDGINESFSRFQAPNESGRHAILDQNINIWELLQPEEDIFDENGLQPELDNQRWITVEREDAGEEGETVLYRSFVNAAIGSKRCRIKSRGAPYLLLLSTKDGESQPKVTICNQIGTISFTRDFTTDDLPDNPLSKATSPGEIHTNDGIPLHFGKPNINIAFTNHDDQDRFMDFPRSYFNAVKRREPRQLDKATETLLYDRSVEVLEQLKPATLKPFTSRQRFRSCNLRILETTGKEGWRTTRRLVMSSSAGDKRAWCTESFLPLSNVRVHREEGTAAILIKWSDCSHEWSDQTDGNYNRIYSYVYDGNNPNMAFSLVFRNVADAIDFEYTVLKLSFSPIYSFSTGPDDRSVYNIMDTLGPERKNYKAMLLTHHHTRFSETWKHSELFYMYRDTDYIFDRTASSIRFPHVFYTDYISSHVEKLYKSDLDRPPPSFSHCERRVGGVSVTFDSEQTGFEFLSAFTTGHELVFSRRARDVRVKLSGRFRSGRKGRAEVQLWKKKGGGIEFLSRWIDKDVGDHKKWISGPVVPQQQTGGNTCFYLDGDDGTMAVLPKTEVQRGGKIDMGALIARDASGRGDGYGKVGKVEVRFESLRDREEFQKAVLEGMGASVSPLLAETKMRSCKREIED